MSGPITDEEAAAIALKDSENEEAQLHRTFSWTKTSPLSRNSQQFDKDVKVLVVWEQPSAKSLVSTRDPDLVQAQQRVVDSFRKNGNVVQNVTLKHMDEAFDLWANQLMQAETREKLFAATLSAGREREISTVYELFKYLLTFGMLSDFTLPCLNLAGIWVFSCSFADFLFYILYIVFDKLGKLYKPQALVEAENQRFNALKEQVYQLLETPLRAGQDPTPPKEKAIMVFPSLPVVAPKHGPLPLALYYGDLAATCIVNVLELPSTQVPTGLGSQDLPTGVQM